MLPGAFHPRIEDLPARLPIFPLGGALLLPGGRLPLNIFEPRYLAMVEDGLARGRMIGMIQPSEPERIGQKQKLYTVGCAGRITSFAETQDGRYLITLTGVCRFRVAEEHPVLRGYRSVTPHWDPFRADLDAPPPISLDRHRLLAGIAGFLAASQLPLNAKVLDDLPDPDLVTTLAMVSPLDAREKQAILEAPTLQDRADTLLAVLEMASFATGSDTTLRQ